MKKPASKKQAFKQGITRREFVKTTAAAGVALGLPGVLSRPARASVPKQEKTKLAVVTGPRARAAEKAVELLGGIGRFVRKGQRVVIKPNMSWARPVESATNTHPDVVSAIARLCIQAGARDVRVLDHTINQPEKCLKLSGIQEACSGIKGVYLFAVNDEKFYREVPVSRGKEARKLKIIQDVLDCDVFINLPTAKSHTTTGVTLGMKNLMGVIWDRRAFHSAMEINQALADLSSAVKVDLIVLDGSRALVTGGPAGPGRVETPNTVIAGTDPVAVDAMGVTLVDWYGQRFSGPQVKHIAAAHKMGLGTLDLNQAEVLRAGV